MSNFCDKIKSKDVIGIDWSNLLYDFVSIVSNKKHADDIRSQASNLYQRSTKDGVLTIDEFKKLELHERVWQQLVSGYKGKKEDLTKLEFIKAGRHYCTGKAS